MRSETVSCALARSSTVSLVAGTPSGAGFSMSGAVLEPGVGTSGCMGMGERGYEKEPSALEGEGRTWVIGFLASARQRLPLSKGEPIGAGEGHAMRYGPSVHLYQASSIGTRHRKRLVWFHDLEPDVVDFAIARFPPSAHATEADRTTEDCTLRCELCRNCYAHDSIG